MNRTKKTAVVMLGAAAVAAAAAGAVVFGGAYDVAATKEHTQLLYTVMETTMHAAVRVRSAGIAVPPLDDPARIARGAACYEVHCVACHGAPGVAQGPMGQGMQPLPGPLVDAARRWHPQELYWITRHGIKMSGMPAWELRFTDDGLWDLVAWLQHLPAVNAAGYRAMQQRAGACAPPADRTPPPHARSAREQALLALRQHACTACHDIPGAVDSSPQVGPPLKGFGRRTTIAGVLPNTRENLVRWIQQPGQVKPGTAMPALQVSDTHAREMADYLLDLN